MLTEIVNHLWQSTLVAAAIAALAAMLRDDGAHARYWLWWAASVKFLVPFSLLSMLGRALGDAGVPRLELADWPATIDVLAQPMPEAASWTPLALALLGVWALGFLAVVGRWTSRALRVRALLRESVWYTAPLPRLANGLEVRASEALLEPALVGILRPVLLLPQAIAEHLTPTQLDAVLEHELSHWRRRDNLTAAVHMLVEAVFWFHPLVWWIGARLVEERERACDEAVVRAGHDGRTYAEGILNVCERYVASALKCAAGISGADLKRRVVEITRNRVMRELPIRKKILLSAFALSTLVVPVIFGAAAQDSSDVMPLVRINPDYPSEALAAKREGVVILEFTVGLNGTTKDIVVVESSSPEFEAPAVAAMMKWRYSPLVENGQPVERRGMRTVLRWELEDAEAEEAE
jgi:bla regulator protein blaR1